MGAGLGELIGAACLFVGSHMLLSGPGRAGLVRRLGERTFLLIYSLVAVAALSLLIITFARTERGTPLWNGTAILPWVAASLLTIVALALFMASFIRNPALPQAPVAGLAARKPWGVFTITRHPMMMALALWAVAHILIAPQPRTIVLCLAILVLALGGAHRQDQRKLAQFKSDWKAWMQRTSFWPRWRQVPALGVIWSLAALAWLGVTGAHSAFGGVRAGLWLWLR